MQSVDRDGSIPDVVLKVDDLCIDARSKSGWSEIVRGVSFELRRGQVLGLVGESGAGKSTIGLACLGYLRGGFKLRSGSIRFQGMDVMAMSDRDRRSLRSTRIAYVAQSASASFNPAIRLIEQIVEIAVGRGGQSRKEAVERAKELFRAFQLPDPERFGDRFPHQVSGGQLQRAMVAMAMICRPDIIVFDEPTTALDVTTQLEVLISIRQAISQFKVAAIYITHDLAIVGQMADNVAVLRYGDMLEYGAAGEVISRPKHPYTQSLWAVGHLAHAEPVQSTDLLELSNISISYGGVVAVRDVSLKLKRGQTLAVVGESGSGKSTLGRSIAGLKSFSGKISFDGIDCPASIAERPKSLLKRIQIIYQSADSALNPKQSVKKIIGRPLQFYHDLDSASAHDRVLDLLDMVGLDRELADRFPRQLSGGQRQRVAIARALAAEPDLIICDEITSALDRVVQADILKLLMDIQQKTGVAYFFITHDIDVVEVISNHIVVLKSGNIAEIGDTRSVLDCPKSDYTRQLISAVPKPKMTWLSDIVNIRLQ